MVLLVVIYFAFISLGLPDAVLGSIWPMMYQDLGLRLGDAGIISAVTSLGTVASILISYRLVARFSTGKVTAFSMLMTAISLWGFGTANSLAALLFWAIPLGVGAGLIDASLNNYVALHYEARHMNWLHSFWGLGASSGPALIALTLAAGFTYQGGWKLLSILQLLLVVALFAVLPRYKVPPKTSQKKQQGAKTQVASTSLFLILSAFFTYCVLEGSTGLWAVSYLVSVKGLLPAEGPLYGSLFFIGITAGRILSGFLSFRFSNKQLIWVGIGVLGLGLVVLLGLPLSGSIVALFLIGLGCAPIFPSFIHETPRRFSIAESQRIIGLEMATAYVGSTLSGPLFGLVAQTIGLRWMVGVQGIFFLLLVISTFLFFRISVVQSLADEN
ncbi:MAG TPA: MFS transporter [Sphaerochaeta sp.]|nr:MFS transporter [Sphaerochaeta sp.]